MRRSRILIAGTVVSLAGVVAGHPPFQPLGVLPGYAWSRACAGGIAQNIVGECGGGPTEAPNRAFLWLYGQGMQALPSPVGTVAARATGMVWPGAIVGMGADGSGLLWPSASSTPTVLPASGLGGTVEPLGVSAYSPMTVVGVVHSAAGLDAAFAWSAGSGYSILPPLATGDSIGAATGISDHGTVIVGRLGNAGSPRGQAVIWTSAGAVGLGWLSAGDSADSGATGVSADGSVIVGYSTGGRLAVCAFMYTAAAGMVDLGGLPGAVESRALGVDYYGREVCGECTFPDGHHEAFFWDRWMGMMGLRQLVLASGGVIPEGWTLTEARALPYGAPLTGNGFDGTGMPVAFGALPKLCFANCDQSTASPLLDVNDFSCFLNRFAAGEAYANCDHSTVAPVLNVLDFICFVNKFAAGCSAS